MSDHHLIESDALSLEGREHVEIPVQQRVN